LRWRQWNYQWLVILALVGRSSNSRLSLKVPQVDENSLDMVRTRHSYLDKISRPKRSLPNLPMRYWAAIALPNARIRSWA
jgi:hypothetical protein